MIFLLKFLPSLPKEQKCISLHELVEINLEVIYLEILCERFLACPFIHLYDGPLVLGDLSVILLDGSTEFPDRVLSFNAYISSAVLKSLCSR